MGNAWLARLLPLAYGKMHGVAFIPSIEMPLDCATCISLFSQFLECELLWVLVNTVWGITGEDQAHGSFARAIYSEKRVVRRGSTQLEVKRKGYNLVGAHCPLHYYPVFYIVIKFQ